MSTSIDATTSRRDEQQTTTGEQTGRRGVFWTAMVGCVLLWASFPRIDLWPLAWLAPIPWIWMIEWPQLPGKRPYLALWLAGFLYYLAVLYFLTLPYWATAFGWLALSAYVALYLPLFVGLARIARHTLGASVIVAAPIIWVGLEFARAHILGGFLMADIAHTQHRWITLIQLSDLSGAYGVSFLMILAPACLARAYAPGQRLMVWPLAVAGLAVGGALAYGQIRLAGEHSSPGPTVALIQGSIDVDFNPPPNRREFMFDQYLTLSREALARGEPLDLIVWPESMFSYGWFTCDPDAPPFKGAELTPKEVESRNREEVLAVAKGFGVPWMFGVDSEHLSASGAVSRANAALAVTPGGEIVGHYEKCHLVMFGEFIPFGDRFPVLYSFSPLAGGLCEGAGPASIKIGEYRYAPTICYETTDPHLVRGQLKALRDAGQEPDVLVNLTNDGWFWGSNELDLHLACGVFRAVECRKPLVIAANTGFSASINAQGEILERGPRRATGVIIAHVACDNRASPYVQHGDLLAGASFLACLSLAVVGAWRRLRPRR